MSLSSGAQLFNRKLEANAASMTQLTNHNAAALAEVRFGEYEQFSFPGAQPANSVLWQHTVLNWLDHNLKQ